MKDKNFYIKVSKKIEKNKYVQSVRDGLMISMPLLIVGSFFLILRFLPVPGYLEFMQKIFGEKWINYIIYPIDTSFGFIDANIFNTPGFSCSCVIPVIPYCQRKPLLRLLLAEVESVEFSSSP